MTAIVEAAAALLGERPVRIGRLHGGNLSQILRIGLADGREAIVKSGPAPRLEAAMLDAIRAAGAPAPAVLAVGDEVLVIEALPAGGSLAEAWADLGTILSGLHDARGARYGWDADFAFGSVAIENGWSEDWPEFWAQRRLRVHSAHLPSDLARRLERLADDLPNRLPRRPKPALLHGDLWGGNVLASEGRISGLIDPACYHGHGEVDLAMLGLFDSPTPAFREAYGAAEPGHAERVPIYALWPALVHLRLFGSGYRSMVERMLSATGV